MNFIKRILGKKEPAIQSNEDFWKWFARHAESFYSVVKTQHNIEKDFFSKLSPKLNSLQQGYFFLTGMIDGNIAELVITADGTVKNMVFCEDLVASAPSIPGWKFTALKPELDMDRFSIDMGGYKFSKDNMSFYAEELPEYPDEISLVMTHDELTEENHKNIGNGIYIFLDNCLGELQFATTIDNIKFLPKKDITEELIPIEKLKPYLVWREKEFREKYEDVRIDTSEQSHSILEATLESGNPLFAVMNTDLLNWDNKASHPWMLKFELPFDGSKNNGLPDNQDFDLLNSVEDELLSALKDINGHLNVGRETAENLRTIYFACNEFRDCSRIAGQIIESHKHQLAISYEIFKDKYWQSLSYFMINVALFGCLFIFSPYF